MDPNTFGIAFESVKFTIPAGPTVRSRTCTVPASHIDTLGGKAFSKLSKPNNVMRRLLLCKCESALREESFPNGMALKSFPNVMARTDIIDQIATLRSEAIFGKGYVGEVSRKAMLRKLSVRAAILQRDDVLYFDGPSHDDVRSQCSTYESTMHGVHAHTTDMSRNRVGHMKHPMGWS